MTRIISAIIIAAAIIVGAFIATHNTTECTASVGNFPTPVQLPQTGEHQ